MNATSNIGMMSREHAVYTARNKQWGLNIKAFRGGDDYIKERLVRAEGETNLSWTGTSQSGEAGHKGRPERTSYVNDARRVVEKISQYLFKAPVTRKGIDAKWEKNVTGNGSGIDAFFIQLCNFYTACGLGWAQVSVNEGKDPVRWTFWPAPSVPDWAFDGNGELLWILVESKVFDNSDPFNAPVEGRIRTLYHKGEDGNVYVSEFGEPIAGVEFKLNFPLGITRVPFVCVGEPDAGPWWFDDVERIQMDLLNLESINTNNLVKSAFLQLVLPASTPNTVRADIAREKGADGEPSVSVVQEIIRSPDHPILEAEDGRNVTRFLTPDFQSLQLIPVEITRKRAMMFQNAGCALLYQETRQIQTAESKQYDLLDTESALKNRAQTLQAVEERLVEVSAVADPSFRTYSPAWPTTFGIFDAAEAERIITLVENSGLATPTMMEMAGALLLKILDNSAGSGDAEWDKVVSEIKAGNAGGVAKPARRGFPPVAGGQG